MNAFNFGIRADGSTEIGKGHLMRCKTLFEALQNKDQKAAFVTVDNEVSRKLFSSHKNIFFISQENCLKPNEWPKSKLYIVDLYNYDEPLYQLIRNEGCEKVFIFDDEIFKLPKISGVINHNIYADNSSYSDDIHKLCGSKYFLLRQELAQIKNDIGSKRNNVFICTGGSDPENQSLKIAKLVRKSTERNIDLVLGVPDDQVIEECESIEGIKVYVDPENIQDIIKSAKYAVSGAGTLAYELAYFGVPSVLIVLADNQMKIAKSFAEKSAGINVGFFKTLSNKKFNDAISLMESTKMEIEKYSKSCKSIIDGKGSDRLVKALINLR